MMDLSSRNNIHGYITVKPSENLSKLQPMDFTVPILDLCIRRRSRTPSPKRELPNETKLPNPTIYEEAPTSTVSISSPGSHSQSSEISENSSDNYYDYNLKLVPQTALMTKVKIPRPFKAYPKNPLTLSTGITAECVLGKGSVEAYSEFRKQMLSQVQATHGITNKNMRRTSQAVLNNNNRGDPTYWEKRRKNNEAAKRSRDARRAKEDEIAIRAAFLEQENIKLRYEVVALRNENEKLKSILYGHTIV